MLENATRICEAKFGVLYSADGDAFPRGGLTRRPAVVCRSCGSAAPIPPKPRDCAGRARGKQTVRQLLPMRRQNGPISMRRSSIRAAALSNRRCADPFLVPMLKEGKLVGAFAIFRQEVRPSPISRSSWCRTSPPRPSSRSRTRGCSTSCASSLQQQTATTDVLKVISRSTFELETVFETLLEIAVRSAMRSRGRCARTTERLPRRSRSIMRRQRSTEFFETCPMSRHPPERSLCAVEPERSRDLRIKADPGYRRFRSSRDVDRASAPLSCADAQGKRAVGAIASIAQEVQPSPTSRSHWYELRRPGGDRHRERAVVRASCISAPTISLSCWSSRPRPRKC